MREFYDIGSITHEQLLNCVSYDPITGLFFKNGKQIGTLGSDGYIVFYLRGRPYKAHRLAWFYIHKRWPKFMIDHRDRDRANNRINNLREVNSSQNSANRPAVKFSASGIKGVSWSTRQKKWTVTIRRDGKNYYLGAYLQIDEAEMIYNRAINMFDMDFNSLIQ